MNTDEVTALLKLRSQLTRNPYGNDTITAWTQALSDVTAEDATTALKLIARNGEASIGVPQIRAQIRAMHPRPVYSEPIGTPGCARCAGTGFTLDHEHRARPCRDCRPDHPLNRLRAV